MSSKQSGWKYTCAPERPPKGAGSRISRAGWVCLRAVLQAGPQGLPAAELLAVQQGMADATRSHKSMIVLPHTLKNRGFLRRVGHGFEARWVLGPRSAGAAWLLVDAEAHADAAPAPVAAPVPKMPLGPRSVFDLGRQAVQP